MDVDSAKVFAATLRSATENAKGATQRASTIKHMTSTAEDIQLAKTQPMFFHSQTPKQASPQYQPVSTATGMFPGVGRSRKRIACGKTNRSTSFSLNNIPPYESHMKREIATGAFADVHSTRPDSTTYGAEYVPPVQQAQRAAQRASFSAPSLAAADGGSVGMARWDSSSSSSSSAAQQAELSSALSALNHAGKAERAGSLAHPKFRTLRKLVQLPWTRRNSQPPAWAPREEQSEQTVSSSNAAAEDAAGASASSSDAFTRRHSMRSRPNYTAEDQAAVRVAITKMGDQLGDLNMRSWFHSVQLPAGGLSTSLPGHQLLKALPAMGIELTPVQERLLMETFYNSTGSGEGRAVDFFHLVSRLRPDDGIAPDVVAYPEKMGHLRINRASARQWPAHSAEQALQLFRDHMEQRRVRASLRTMGFVNQVDYAAFGKVLTSLNIHVEKPELERLCQSLDNGQKKFLTFSDLFPDDEADHHNTYTPSSSTSSFSSSSSSSDRTPLSSSFATSSERQQQQEPSFHRGSRRAMLAARAAGVDISASSTSTSTSSVPVAQSEGWRRLAVAPKVGQSPLTTREAYTEVSGLDETPTSSSSTTLGASGIDASIVPPLLQRNGYFLHRQPTAAAAAEPSAPSPFIPTYTVHAPPPAPTRYGRTFIGRLNSARTVAPWLNEPEVPYAKADQTHSTGGTHFDTSAAERFQPREAAIAAMQAEDRQRKHARQNQVGARIAQHEADTMQRIEERADLALQRDQEKRRAIVNTRLRFCDSVQSRPQPQNTADE